MNRISARIGAAVAGVRCPGCNQNVIPTTAYLDDAASNNATVSDSTDTGKRWSFVWRPASGNTCPNCSFPLDRYARRLKWIRVFRAAVVLLVVGLVLLMVNRYTEMPNWVVILYKGLGIAGLVAFLVGGIGMIVGERHA